MQAETKVNDMRASRTLIILEADTVYGVEGNREVYVIVSISSSSGVCVVGMHEIVQSRNLGDPSCSREGSCKQSGRSCNDGSWEVRCVHSTEEVG